VSSSVDETLARMALELRTAADFAGTAVIVVRFACETIRTDHAGITVLRGGGRLRSVGVSDPLVREADRLQYELGEGPCVQATVEQRTLLSDDLHGDARWPRWGPRAAAIGFSSVLSAQLHAGDQHIGALNLYGARPAQFSADDAETAHLFGFHAAAALAAAHSDESLRAALDSRTVIGQAQGILMERFDVDADRAFTILRRYSQDTNTKLRDVAEEVARTRRLPGP
jgi:GAF domain-containing protein